MAKRIKLVISAALVLVMMLVLSACGGKTETGVATGTLKEATQDAIVLSTDDGLQEFKTSDTTVYDLGGMDELNLDDVVDIDYHASGDTKTADKVILREHIQKDLTFNGQVTDITDKSITVTGKSLTVTFVINEDTEIKGEPSKGDEVALVYMGDLNEYPYASIISVSKEAAKEPEKMTVSGTVTEFTEKSMLVTIDSSKSYRFALDKSTQVTGVAKYVRVGDSVTVYFEGDVKSTPKATRIDIVKEKPEEIEIKLLNGTIDTVAKTYVTLNTGKKVYMVQTDKNTKYSGDKPAKGYKAEIQYTGTLDSGRALATNIYCVKQTPEPTVYKVKFVDGFGNTIKTVKVDKGKAAVAPADPQRKGYKFKGWDKSFNKVTKDMTVTALWTKDAKPAPAPTPAPEPEPIPDPDPEPAEQTTVIDAVITQWTSDAPGETNFFKVKTDDGVEIGINIEDDLDIPSGYIPEVGDRVRVTYFLKSAKLVKMELLEKAQKEDPVVPEEETQPEEETTPEEKQEETETEPEPETEPEVIISGEGIIGKGDPEKKTFTVEIEGNTIELKFDENSKAATGYFPQTGDNVRIEYSKSDMLLREIQLLERPEPAADGSAASEEAPAEEAAE